MLPSLAPGSISFSDAWFHCWRAGATEVLLVPILPLFSGLTRPRCQGRCANQRRVQRKRLMRVGWEASSFVLLPQTGTNEKIYQEWNHVVLQFCNLESPKWKRWQVWLSEAWATYHMAQNGRTSARTSLGHVFSNPVVLHLLKVEAL